jgi:hypothetical protein
MYFWPIVISIAVLAVAALLFMILPEIIDAGTSFLWVIAGFLVIYIGAALYLSHSIPAWGQTDQSNVVDDGTVESSVTDVISK